MKLQLINMVILITGFVVSASAQADLQLGTRPQGLGGAFVAVSDDANAAFWNPAGLSQIKRGEVTLMHWKFSELNEISINSAAGAYPFTSGTFALSWVRQAAELEEGPINSKSTFSQNNIMLSFGISFTPWLSGGLSLNRMIIDSKIGGGGGWGFDFGTMLKPLQTKDWTIAATAKHVAGNLKNSFLSPYYIFGTAYKFVTDDKIHTLLIAVDGNTHDNIDGKESITLKYATGLEYQFLINNYLLAVRGGLASKTYSFGGSFGYQFFSTDYAFVIMREKTIGNSHRFGVSLNF